MPQDQALNGRVERRLPIIVVVSLAHLERGSIEGAEWTYTDNISAHGARVFSKRSWSPGEEITVTPFREETTRGSVAYCQRLADGRCFIGVKFRDRQVPWSAISRYDGIQISATVRSKSS
jgi:hypothetical protein